VTGASAFRRLASPTRDRSGALHLHQVRAQRPLAQRSAYLWRGWRLLSP
jgi:hypothetical protein